MVSNSKGCEGESGNHANDFCMESRNVVPKSYPTLCHSPVGLRALSRMQDVEFWVVMIEGEPLKLTESESPHAAEVLQTFAEMFGEPEGLSPKREADHRI